MTASANGTTLSFAASTDGSKNYVSVQSLAGTFAVTGGTSGKAFGTDAKVEVNGAAARPTAPTSPTATTTWTFSSA